MGGEAAGPVDRAEHDMALWEKQLEAVVYLLTGYKTRDLRVDELRRHIESLPPEVYDSAGYYGRWALAVTNHLVEQGILDRAELEARVKARQQ
jgi:hypothetical protein